jgi:hypothetical protein
MERRRHSFEAETPVRQRREARGMRRARLGRISAHVRVSRRILSPLSCVCLCTLCKPGHSAHPPCVRPCRAVRANSTFADRFCAIADRRLRARHRIRMLGRLSGTGGQADESEVNASIGRPPPRTPLSLCANVALVRRHPVRTKAGSTTGKPDPLKTSAALTRRIPMRRTL